MRTLERTSTLKQQTGNGIDSVVRVVTFGEDNQGRKPEGCVSLPEATEINQAELIRQLVIGCGARRELLAILRNVLSCRELQVLIYIGTGVKKKHYEEILGIKCSQRYRTNIQNKLGLKSSVDMARLVLSVGLTVEDLGGAA